MSFFDTILDSTEKPEITDTVQHLATTPAPGRNQATEKNSENQKNQLKNGVSEHQPAASPQKKTMAKPEKLSFLRPCPICGGRKFIYGAAGGFFCVVCQPGIQGQPVEATGPERDPGGRELEGRNLRDDLEIGPGTQGPYPEISSKLSIAPEREKITGLEQQNFAAAWPVLKELMPTLLAAGWSRAALLRRGKHRGGRGLAWLPVWQKHGLVATVGTHGQLFLTFESGSRKVQQTAWPDVSFFQRPEIFQVDRHGRVRNPLRRRGPRKDPVTQPAPLSPAPD